jgi:nucleotide-binding universal stress UspA family protein
VPVETHLDEIRDRFENRWCAPLAGLRYRTELRYGSPVGAILDLADETDADMIVLGSRGLGGFPELLLGSTSSQVSQHSRRPVLIVPIPRA